MLKLAADALRLSSVAVHRTSVSPTAKFDPEAGAQVIVGLASTMSLAVGLG
jgi:hypothetical protein